MVLSHRGLRRLVYLFRYLRSILHFRFTFSLAALKVPSAFSTDYKTFSSMMLTGCYIAARDAVFPSLLSFLASVSIRSFPSFP